MVVHLSEETLSDLLDGDRVVGAEEHLADCERCRRELEAYRRLRAELRNLPRLHAPEGLWARIEQGLPAAASRSGGFRLGRPGMLALQAAAMAAVFVLGLGLGRIFEPGGAQEIVTPQAVSAEQGQAVSAEQESEGSLAGALAEVRRRGAEYDEALRNLERLAREEGASVGSLVEQRLVSLNMLVEASRTALAADPADPTLNAYLFAALEERDRVMQQMGAEADDGSAVLWR